MSASNTTQYKIDVKKFKASQEGFSNGYSEMIRIGVGQLLNASENETIQGPTQMMLSFLLDSKIITTIKSE